MTPRTKSIRDILTPYRIAYTVALVTAALLLVFGFQHAHSENTRQAGCTVGPIVALIPCPGDIGLSQGLIGVSLTSGYQAAIIVDQTEIPADQVRTGGANQIYFQPGPGTETGPLAPGNHSATVVYWPSTGTRERNAKTYSWDFTVT